MNQAMTDAGVLRRAAAIMQRESRKPNSIAMRSFVDMLLLVAAKLDRKPDA